MGISVTEFSLTSPNYLGMTRILFLFTKPENVAETQGHFQISLSTHGVQNVFLNS